MLRKASPRFLQRFWANEKLGENNNSNNKNNNNHFCWVSEKMGLAEYYKTQQTLRGNGNKGNYKGMFSQFDPQMLAKNKKITASGKVHISTTRKK